MSCFSAALWFFLAILHNALISDVAIRRSSNVIHYHIYTYTALSRPTETFFRDLDVDRSRRRWFRWFLGAFYCRQVDDKGFQAYRNCRYSGFTQFSLVSIAPNHATVVCKGFTLVTEIFWINCHSFLKLSQWSTAACLMVYGLSHMANHKLIINIFSPRHENILLM